MTGKVDVIKLKFFAMLKGLVGRDEVDLELTLPTTLLQLKSVIAKEYPVLTELLEKRKLLISVNEELATDSTVIKSGDEVAFLPPFSGG